MLADDIDLTVPARNLVQRLFSDFEASRRLNTYLTAQSYVDSTDIATVIAMAAQEVENYYADEDPFDRQAQPGPLASKEFKVSLAALITQHSRTSFASPQRHFGNVARLASPKIANRSYRSALPRGAFWTATLVHETDTWTLSEPQGNGLSAEPHLVTFNRKDVKCYVIDSAAAWAKLVSKYPADKEAPSAPSWKDVAKEYDSVHLSLAGLLSAHPGALDKGIIGIAEWSTVSTAWLRLPAASKLLVVPEL